MPTAITSTEVQAELTKVRQPTPPKTMALSPEDWRDHWIYFTMVDCFNNPDAPQPLTLRRQIRGLPGQPDCRHPPAIP